MDERSATSNGGTPVRFHELTDDSIAVLSDATTCQVILAVAERDLAAEDVAREVGLDGSVVVDRLVRPAPLGLVEITSTPHEGRRVFHSRFPMLRDFGALPSARIVLRSTVL